MSKILVTLIAVALMLSSVMASDNVVTRGGVHMFMRDGAKTQIGYSFGGDVPTGVDAKTVVKVDTVLTSGNVIRYDTTFNTTYQLVVRADLFYSDFAFDDEVKEIEGQRAAMINTKTLGLWTLFMDLGGTVWNIPNTAGDNQTLTGYYIGLGADASGVGFLIGADIIPVKDEADLFVAGLKIGYKF